MARDSDALAADAAASALDSGATAVRQKRRRAARPLEAATPAVSVVAATALAATAGGAAFDPVFDAVFDAHADAAPRVDAASHGEHDGGNDSAAGADTSDGVPPGPFYHRIGHLTRTLHDALRELGYDRDLADVKEHLPDARDRLGYIARVTGEAAEKVLNAVDRARTVQQGLSAQADSLHKRWQAVVAFAHGADRATPAGRMLVEETCSFFSGVGGQADATNTILTDIMMAQDFHDLTGQVIRKIVALATTMEEQLVRLLIDSTPPERRKRVDGAIIEPSLDGPVVNGAGRSEIVTNQSQVDDLLATLGF